MAEQKREKLGSRLGFILISAGCAVGLGNVWRFPYIVGQYGGGAFVVFYLLFLAVFALPIMVMEFTVGRGGQAGVAKHFDNLEPHGSKWHRFKWVALAGNYLLMMFYTVVAGWMVAFMVKSASGAFNGADAAATAQVFSDLLANPNELILWLLIVVAVGILATGLGVQNGVERITKVMMAALFVVLVVLCVHSLTLPGAAAGLSFYLVPDFGKMFSHGASGFAEVTFAAMGQAFFTLSVGIGSMSIFGSYTNRERSLMGESLRIGLLDTLVAIMAGLIIFPSCFTYGVDAGSGPGLVFITLPAVFSQMPLGQLWCTLFFLFLSCAALSTVIAVFENIMGFSIDQWGVSRKKAVAVNGILILVLSIPCALGFNVWSDLVVPGIGDIQSVEDFLVSNNILPLGALVFLLFCTSNKGWGWGNFLAEANTGKGMKFPSLMYKYLKYVVPVLIIVVIVMGWMPIVSSWMGLA